ncbi:MAG: nicotinate phosphoribosyltransferase [Gammaproteobacteria bacterium]|nr:MAG: nicotinate phosphoribosyltransferase [Gammaproteobacteria bacterium]
MIIKSLLDTDLYKFTMMQVVLHRFPAANVEYRFKCRNAGMDLRPYADEIRQEIAALCTLRFTEDELQYLSTLRFFTSDFIDLLGMFYLQERFVDVVATGDDLEIIIRGPWLHTILFEVPVLAIVNEVYFRNLVSNPDIEEGRRRLNAKIDAVKTNANAQGFVLADFGSRRRFSGDWHDQVVAKLKEQLPDNLAGTSNVNLARKYNLRPIGTMAHEYLQGCQALGPRLIESQKFAFDTWAREYRGDLGIALSDVVGFDAFLRDFDLYFSKLFDGARHDSGDPFAWGERMIAHYQSMKIDPRTKNLVFSDGLNMEKALALYQQFKGRINTSFGIGTNLTNDLGYEPLQIVIKMTECNGQPVAKVSDSPGKAMCRDDGFVKYLRKVFKIDGE